MVSAKKKIYLTTIGFIVIFAVMSVVFLAPAIFGLAQASRTIALNQVTIELLDSKIGNIADLKQKQALIDEYLAEIKRSFVDASAPVDFMNFLENEAQSANLVIKTTASFPTGGEKDQQFNAEFQVTAGGSSNNCLRFLEKLEQSPWFLEIDNFNIQRVNEKTTIQKGFERLMPGDVFCMYSLKTFAPSVLDKKVSSNSSKSDENN